MCHGLILLTQTANRFTWILFAWLDSWRGHHLKWDCVHIRQSSVFVLCLINVAVGSMTDECYLNFSNLMVSAHFCHPIFKNRIIVGTGRICYFCCSDIFYLYLNINTHSLSIGAAYSHIYLWFIPNFLVVMLSDAACYCYTDIKEVELHLHFCGRMHLSLRTQKCLTQLNIFKIMTINWLVHNSFHTIHL